MINKLLISIDSEGQAGIVRNSIPKPDNVLKRIFFKLVAKAQSPSFIYGPAQGYENRIQMTLEAAAAAECAIEAGVKDVVIRDGGFIRGVADSVCALFKTNYHLAFDLLLVQRLFMTWPKRVLMQQFF